MKEDVLFWDVDTQFDFMRPEGALYVPDADEIVATVERIRAEALDHGYSMIASTDWHGRENPEISDDPDFKTTYPPHCMAATPGAERVGYTGSLSIDYVGLAPDSPAALKKLVNRAQFHIVIRKETTDVFSNPNTARLVEIAAPRRIVVFGVALDVCVEHTIRGLVKFPNVKVQLVTDATKAIDPGGAGPLLGELERLGVQLTSASQMQGQA